MHTINQILGSSLLLTAEPESPFHPSAPAGTRSYDNNQWSFTFDPAHGKSAEPAITSLKFKKDGHSIDVCSRIEWSTVKIALHTQAHSAAVEYDFPLTKDFCLGYHECLRKQKVQQSVWWLENLPISTGIQLVYGYTIINGKIEPIPIDEREIFTDFITDYEAIIQTSREWLFEEEKEKEIQSIGLPGTKIILHAAYPRILITASFIVCEPEKRFEPQSVLKAARIYPLVTIKTNDKISKVNTIKTNILVMRNKLTDHCGFDNPDGKMTKTRGLMLFADRNIEGNFDNWEASDVLPLIPNWDNVFEYYDLIPKAGSEFVMTDPDKADRRKLENTRKIRNVVHPYQALPYVEEVFTDSVKEIYQGEFDNVHIAPRMLLGNEEVVMAPVCQHDCFHMHLRWGTHLGKDRHILGWGLLPYTIPGGPLVAPNQRVKIAVSESDSEIGFNYNVKILNPFHRMTQFVFHNGCAYAIEVENSFSIRAGLFIRGSWANFYRRLRYFELLNETMSRVVEDPAIFAKLKAH